MYQTEKNVANFGLECRVLINFMDEFWLFDVLFFTLDMTLIYCTVNKFLLLQIIFNSEYRIKIIGLSTTCNH